jgi:acetyltransferase-like isoleucine patch superfamily enzyme
MSFIFKIINFGFRQLWWLLNFSRFKKFGYRSFIYNSLRINGSKNISIGSKVFIGYKSLLASVPLSKQTNSELIIGHGCSIGNFNHIFATESIRIGNCVLTADKVYISDNMHGYEDIGTPILYQNVKQINTVEIGDGTWIGENACILGAKIGKNCVVGAN